MLKRTIAAFSLVFTLSTPSVGHAYIIPVIDVAAIAQLTIQVATAIQQLLILEAQLQDMAFQATVGDVPWNHDTDDLLNEMADYKRDEDGLLYGDSLDQKWPEVFQGDTPWEEGGWLEASVDRSRQTLATQQHLAHLITMRNNAFAQDQVRMIRLQNAVDTAYSRNQLIKAQSAVSVEVARQHQMGQQMEMTIANMQAVSNANEVNEKMSREAQERFFLTDGDKEPERPVFQYSGIY